VNSPEDKRKITELRERLTKNPSSAEFVDLVRLLSENPDTRSEAREICFHAVNENPRNTVGRLLLARLFYLDGLGEFCVRELVELKKYTNSPSLDKLLDAFGEYAKSFMPVAGRSADILAKPMVRAKEAVSKQAEAQAESDENEAVLAELDLDFAEAFEELDK
jgi:hypothetical protein